MFVAFPPGFFLGSSVGDGRPLLAEDLLDVLGLRFRRILLTDGFLLCLSPPRENFLLFPPLPQRFLKKWRPLSILAFFRQSSDGAFLSPFSFPSFLFFYFGFNIRAVSFDKYKNVFFSRVCCLFLIAFLFCPQTGGTLVAMMEPLLFQVGKPSGMRCALYLRS